MHNMSNLNKFQKIYQIVKKNLGFFFSINKSSNIHKECYFFFFGPKILPTNTLGTDVHKMYEYDKNQVPYYNVKKLKK